jgi:hypothetical protein
MDRPKIKLHIKREFDEESDHELFEAFIGDSYYLMCFRTLERDINDFVWRADVLNAAGIRLFRTIQMHETSLSAYVEAFTFVMKHIELKNYAYYGITSDDFEIVQDIH